jgi:hypothetical protein
VKLELFSLSWILTAFAHTFPLHMVCRIWDFVLLHSTPPHTRAKNSMLEDPTGPQLLVVLATCLLVQLRSTILALDDFGAVATLLTRMPVALEPLLTSAMDTASMCLRLTPRLREVELLSGNDEGGDGESEVSSHIGGRTPASLRCPTLSPKVYADLCTGEGEEEGAASALVVTVCAERHRQQPQESASKADGSDVEVVVDRDKRTMSVQLKLVTLGGNRTGLVVGEADVLDKVCHQVQSLRVELKSRVVVVVGERPSKDDGSKGRHALSASAAAKLVANALVGHRVPFVCVLHDPDADDVGSGSDSDSDDDDGWQDVGSAGSAGASEDEVEEGEAESHGGGGTTTTSDGVGIGAGDASILDVSNVPGVDSGNSGGDDDSEDEGSVGDGYLI